MPAQEPHLVPGLTVLVVDDNSTNRRILTDLLQRWGMKPVAAAGGLEALALARRAGEAGDPFRVILTDVQMPEMDGFELAEKLKQSPSTSGAIILMLTSCEFPGDIARSRRAGVSNYLLKPVRGEELLDTIAAALGAQPVSQSDVGAAGSIPRHLPRPLPASPSRILLAEDNLVNQRLVQRLLEKEGHAVVVVANGREAVEALQKDNFDLVLMDVQMPEMDGLEATRSIRASETITQTHIPILALTAHAMKGDLDRCLAAGMDAYLSKPVHASDLFEILKTYGKKECEPLPA